MTSQNGSLLADVAQYYSEKLATHGETPQGVDWNGVEGQELRFAQLCKVIAGGERFSANDLGCGYGAFFDYLRARHAGVTYAGWDVSADMVTAAQARHAGAPNASFGVAAEPRTAADYGFASGIFNVRLQADEGDWKQYIRQTLDALDRSSTRGFAFNCLTSYSDAEKMRDYLHYADPCELFDYCKRRYSRNVALLHDYGLYEFTILVRKVV